MLMWSQRGRNCDSLREYSLTRPANHSRERSERLAKVGGVSGTISATGSSMLLEDGVMTLQAQAWPVPRSMRRVRVDVSLGRLA